MKIPTMLTLMRLAIIPFIILFYYIPFHSMRIVVAILFILACLTDWLDGYLARKLNQTTRFGAFLDPVVDKIIVAVALVLLVSDPRLPYLVIPVAVIICREIAISALREWMAEIGKRTSIAVSFMGKVKTTIQMIAVIALLACNPANPNWVMYVGYILLYVAAILTIWSMAIYLRAAWPNFELK